MCHEDIKNIGQIITKVGKYTGLSKSTKQFKIWIIHQESENNSLLHFNQYTMKIFQMILLLNSKTDLNKLYNKHFVPGQG